MHAQEHHLCHTALAGVLVLTGARAAASEADEPDAELLEYLGEFADQDDWSWFDSSDEEAASAEARPTRAAASEQGEIAP